MENGNKKYKERQGAASLEKVRELLDKMPEFMNFFSLYLTGNGCSEGTILAYVQDIDLFFYYLQAGPGTENGVVTTAFLEGLSPDKIEGFSEYIRTYRRNGKDRKNGEGARRRKMVSVKRLYAFLLATGRISKDPAKDVRMPKENGKKKGMTSSMSREDARLLYTVVRESEGLSARQMARNRGNEMRDDAIITLLLNTGIRVSELVGLDLEDVNVACGYIRVQRKKGIEGTVYVNHDTMALLDDYIQNGRRAPETDLSALFISKNGSRITVRSVERLIKKYAKAAGMDITALGLRRAHGTIVYKDTLDLGAVAARLGHKSIGAAYRAYASGGSRDERRTSEVKI